MGRRQRGLSSSDRRLLTAAPCLPPLLRPAVVPSPLSPRTRTPSRMVRGCWRRQSTWHAAPALAVQRHHPPALGPDHLWRLVGDFSAICVGMNRANVDRQVVRRAVRLFVGDVPRGSGSWLAGRSRACVGPSITSRRVSPPASSSAGGLRRGPSRPRRPAPRARPGCRTGGRGDAMMHTRGEAGPPAAVWRMRQLVLLGIGTTLLCSSADAASGSAIMTRARAVTAGVSDIELWNVTKVYGSGAGRCLRSCSRIRA